MRKKSIQQVESHVGLQQALCDAFGLLDHAQQCRECNHIEHQTHRCSAFELNLPHPIMAALEIIGMIAHSPRPRAQVNRFVA